MNSVPPPMLSKVFQIDKNILLVYACWKSNFEILKYFQHEKNVRKVFRKVDFTQLPIVNEPITNILLFHLNY